MLKTLLRVLAGPLWRISMETRLEALEARCAALADRFNRFQSREGMRQARAAKEDGSTLEREVEALLSDPSRAGEPVPADKVELWKRRRGMQ